MSNSQSASSSKIAAGRCATHGIVSDEDVNIEFPVEATCEICGKELKTAGYVSPEKLEATTNGK